MRDKKPSEPPKNPKEPRFRHEKHKYSYPKEEYLDAPSRKINNETDYSIAIVLHCVYDCVRQNCDSIKSVKGTFDVEDIREKLDLSSDLSEEYICELAFDTGKVMSPNHVEFTDTKTGNSEIVEVKEIYSDENTNVCHGAPV